MNPKHQEELERLIDDEISEQNLDEVSPITRWLQFESDLRDLHRPAMFDTDYCNECGDLAPCDTIRLFDAYLEDS